MSLAGILAALSALAAAAATRELIADHGTALAERFRRRGRRLAGSEVAGGLTGALDIGGRIRRAGLDGAVGTRAVLAAKLAGAGAGAAVWGLSGPGMPPRIAALLFGLCLLAGFMLPDLVLERVARDRVATLRAELADSLDLIALEVGSGGSVLRALSSAAGRGAGTLAEELGRSVAAIESGARTSAVLTGLGEAIRVEELTLAGRALERSHRLGSPLDEELRSQAASLRRRRARSVREQADRAGPKIQLVVALALVPAALLVIGAAFAAHAGSLLAGL